MVETKPENVVFSGPTLETVVERKNERGEKEKPKLR